MGGNRVIFFFQAEDGIRDLVRSRGLGDVYKRQHMNTPVEAAPERTEVHCPESVTEVQTEQHIEAVYSSDSTEAPPAVPEQPKSTPARSTPARSTPVRKSPVRGGSPVLKKSPVKTAAPGLKFPSKTKLAVPSGGSKLPGPATRATKSKGVVSA
eukprot:TRINITY_DN7551_c0_g2_i1.p1 TRINITY_DN7551_c0_g2~~TRINITY_DN7551_c0_g2_i1.p1  ORF type:complete len:154 (-),score=34.22 TRINITY_DN7551_c0_g2_i1:115-576(-)